MYLLFNEVKLMSAEQRQQLRQNHQQQSVPVVALPVEKIMKVAGEFGRAGVGLGDAVCTIMKHQDGAYEQYRRENFR